MNSTRRKLNLILVPYLILAISIIAGYTFLHWFLFIKNQVFNVKEEILDFLIPMALPWIPILIWLRPRIKRLSLISQKGNLPGLYIFIAGLAIAIPTAIAQSYLDTASGKLTKLTSISHIEDQESTKYYSLQNFYIDKLHIGVKSHFTVTGKNNEYFNMNMYVVLPILNNVTDTTSQKSFAWYGIRYSKQISNKLSTEEKEESFKEFATESQKDFDNKDVNQFVYLEKLGTTSDLPQYLEAIKENRTFTGSSSTILLPINTPFETRNGNKLAWLLGTFVGGIITWIIMILIPTLQNEEIIEEKPGQEFMEGISLLIPRKHNLISTLIIDTNILIFLIMCCAGLGFVSFEAQDLLKWGGNYKPSTTNDQWWRLLTSTFLHGGVFHLLTNMLGMLFVSLFLEPLLGKFRFALAYLVTGIVASIASLYWHKATVSVGASGAIFGLYGIFLALLLTKVFSKEINKAFLASTIIFLGYNLLMGFSSNGIDNAAHIGGLLSGFILGLLFYPSLKNQVDIQPIEDLKPETVE